MGKYRKYENFREEDFMIDEYFQDWIINPDAEKDAFWEQFVITHPKKREIVERVAKLLRFIRFEEIRPADNKVERSLEYTLARIHSDRENIVELYNEPKRVKLIYKNWWAAAAVLLLLASAGYFLFYQASSKSELAKNEKEQAIKKNDIIPGGNKAVLTLANGSSIILDSAQNGTLTQQGSAKVVKLDDGQLAYTTSGNSNEMLYNVITTPRGGQYQMILSDGSKVWLNAASSIKFPVAFMGNERKVEITGEAYFEVTPSFSTNRGEKKSFIVDAAGEGEIEVLGTHFNVNAYNDDGDIRTTLLEGSVKVSSGKESKMIQPGEQAVLSYKTVQVRKDINPDEVIAWKNGLFQFKDADIQTVMRAIERWYDVKANYPKGIPNDRYSGSIRRDQQLSDVFKVLIESGASFKIEGRNVIVLPD